MVLNDQTICIEIARKPGIRAVEIADALDASLSDVSGALRTLVEVGDITRTSGMSPGGQPAQLYELSSAFKKTPEYGVIMTKVNAAPVSPSEAGAVESPVVPAPPGRVSRTDRAVAFILEHGSVTDAQLRVEMGIKAEEYPSTYLSMAVAAGRVGRDGRNWVPGNGLPPKQIAKQAAFGGGIALAGSTPVSKEAPGKARLTKEPASVAPVTAEPAISSQADVAQNTPTAGAFRCAVWSDGVIELQRGGVRLAELTQQEGETISHYITAQSRGGTT